MTFAMARALHIEFASTLYHVTARGAVRRWIPYDYLKAANDMRTTNGSTFSAIPTTHTHPGASARADS